MNSLWMTASVLRPDPGRTHIFLGISTIVGLVLRHVSNETLRRWLSRRGLLGNVCAAGEPCYMS
jgi:hypothetical protein